MFQELDVWEQTPATAGHDQSDVAWLGTHLMAICENQGWMCVVEAGPGLWKKTMLAEDGWINPTFNADKSPVDRTNSASVVIRDRNGAFVACNAYRLFETGSFAGVLSSGELFYRDDLRPANGLQTILPPDFQDFAGRVGYSGGTMISRRYRGKRLGLLTTRLVRVYGERVHKVDHHAGNIFQNRPNDPYPRHPYHFRRCTLCMPHMRIPDRREEYLIFLLESTRAEFLAQVRRDVGQLVREGDKTLNDLALLIA